ncbi:MAG TPA: hypothetical protein VIM16_00935 [Mucilaginibacter sp.]|jgi:hypothetical protein
MSKFSISYEVVSLPSNREKLSPQLKALVNTIEFLKEDVDGKFFVDRDKVYQSWLDDIDMTNNDKVFASYIHQLVQFAFIDRVEVERKAKKVHTVDELKAMIEKQIKMLKIAEKAAELTAIENAEASHKLTEKLDRAEYTESL